MFGFVVANQKALTPEQLRRYRAFYCGLCRSLSGRHGASARLTLTYDMTFLVLLLGSLYEPEETRGMERCAPHPVRPHEWVQTRFTDYAADLNVLLAYYNCEDDWADDRNAIKHAGALLLKPRLPALQKAYPRQCGAVERGIGTLRRIEAENGTADEAANCFAALMGELFVPDEADHWAGTLRRFGAALGRFIYLMDACLDVEADVRRGRYNPLQAWSREPAFEGRCRDMLTMLIGEAALAFETLPLIQDVQILRNILYSGVWTRYALLQEKRRQKERKNS